MKANRMRKIIEKNVLYGPPYESTDECIICDISIYNIPNFYGYN